MGTCSCLRSLRFPLSYALQNFHEHLATSSSPPHNLPIRCEANLSNQFHACPVINKHKHKVATKQKHRQCHVSRWKQMPKKLHLLHLYLKIDVSSVGPLSIKQRHNRPDPSSTKHTQLCLENLRVIVSDNGNIIPMRGMLACLLPLEKQSTSSS